MAAPLRVTISHGEDHERLQLASAIEGFLFTCSAWCSIRLSEAPPHGVPLQTLGWIDIKVDHEVSDQLRDEPVVATVPKKPVVTWFTKPGPTLAALQLNLPWTIRYSADFRSNPQPHKDMAHALVHVMKAAGRLAEMVDDMDHRKEEAENPELRESMAKCLSDLVICALRAANTAPGGPIDLGRAVVTRLETKNSVDLSGVFQ